MKHKAFTMIEMMVSLAIAAVLFLITAEVITSFAKMSSKINDDSRMNIISNKIYDKFSEVRGAMAISCTSYDKLLYVLPNRDIDGRIIYPIKPQSQNNKVIWNVIYIEQKFYPFINSISPFENNHPVMSSRLDNDTLSGGQKIEQTLFAAKFLGLDISNDSWQTPPIFDTSTILMNDNNGYATYPIDILGKDVILNRDNLSYTDINILRSDGFNWNVKNGFGFQLMKKSVNICIDLNNLNDIEKSLNNNSNRIYYTVNLDYI